MATTLERQIKANWPGIKLCKLFLFLIILYFVRSEDAFWLLSTGLKFDLKCCFNFVFYMTLNVFHLYANRGES